MKEEGHTIISTDFHEAYRLLYLIRAFILKNLSAKEREELDAWLEQSDENITLFENLTEDDQVENTMALYEQMREEDALRRLRNRIPFVIPRQKKSSVRIWFSVAAIFIILVSVGLFIYPKSNKKLEQVAKAEKPEAKPAEEIRPGGNRAVLITENGQRIVLDSLANGQLIAGTGVVKGSGLIAYDGQAQPHNTSPVFHTLVTPRGGQYQAILSDGTKVWLNAASSLKYPEVFTGTDRVVELTGEGYFEVAHNSKPFKVKMDDCSVEDLGTAFNINTYKDEGCNKTTLTEGSAKVTTPLASKILVPGQEAKVENEKIRVVPADIEATKGWINGKLVYRFTPMKFVLKDLERWYNIEIDNKHLGTSHLKATIDRDVPLSQMIRILEGAGDVRLKWDGTKLVVLP